LYTSNKAILVFHTATSSGEVGELTIFWYEISSEYRTPKLLKSI